LQVILRFWLGTYNSSTPAWQTDVSRAGATTRRGFFPDARTLASEWAGAARRGVPPAKGRTAAARAAMIRRNASKQYQEKKASKDVRGREESAHKKAVFGS